MSYSFLDMYIGAVLWQIVKASPHDLPKAILFKGFRLQAAIDTAHESGNPYLHCLMPRCL